jgi:RES domain-containing protein
MLAGPELDAALLMLPTIRFAGSSWRAVFDRALHNPAYSTDPLYCDGARANGARYTAVGGPRSIYFTESLEAARVEVNQAFLQVQRSSPSAVSEPPTTYFVVNVELERVLDMTNPVNLAALATSEAELVADWMYFQALGRTAPTQELGAAVCRTGHAQAIRYYSAASARLLGVQALCLVIFCDQVPPGFVEVYDPFGPLRRRMP